MDRVYEVFRPNRGCLIKCPKGGVNVPNSDESDEKRIKLRTTFTDEKRKC